MSSKRIAPDAEESQPFIPPTIEPTKVATSPSTQIATDSNLEVETDSQAGDENLEIEPVARNCEDNLTFISDVTIPDGTIVVAGSTLDKQWEIENSGTCNWDARYKIRLISGPEMGASTEQSLAPARSGSRTIIRVTFTAPNPPGSYQSVWQAYNVENLPFGDQFYIDIVVE